MFPRVVFALQIAVFGVILQVSLRNANCAVPDASVTHSSTAAMLASSTAYSWSQTERKCACNIDKLWLDIIIAIDSSSSMGEIGVINVSHVFGAILARRSTSTFTHDLHL